MKTPKQLEVWSDLPRSKVGKVLKAEIKARLLARMNRSTSDKAFWRRAAW